MIRMGIIGENYQNDACAFKAFLTPQYKEHIEFVPILKSLNGGTPPVDKLLRMLQPEMRKEKLTALLCILDLDTEAKRQERRDWFAKIRKGTSLNCVFYLAVMELEALILADIETFNSIYGVQGQYTSNPKFEEDPKKVLKKRTDKYATKAKRQYEENHAIEVFSQLRFETVYKKHEGEDSFQAFIDAFEKQFKIEKGEKSTKKKK